MEYKVRTEPLELQVMRILIARADLAESDRQYYRNLEKGYEGELFLILLLGNSRATASF